MSKFNDPQGFTNMVYTAVIRVMRTVTMPVQSAIRYVRNAFTGQSVARKAANDVTESVKNLTKPPESIREYVDAGQYYVARVVVYLMLLVLIVTPALILNYVVPPVRARFFTRTMPIDSVDIPSYTGKVRLTDRSSGTVLFEGALQSGRINGFGKLYDYDGNTRYEGTFQMEVYQ